MFHGVFTALITPFDEALAIDEDALRELVSRQIEAGVDGLVPVGTTGESPTVSHEENIEVIRIVVEETAGRVPVIAGTGSNSTAEAIDMTVRAKALGRTQPCRWRRTTTNPARRAFTVISKRWPGTAACRYWYTISPGVRQKISMPKPFSVFLKSRESSGRRKPAETCPRSWT
jgi:hypothetical protein